MEDEEGRRVYSQTETDRKEETKTKHQKKKSSLSQRIRRATDNPKK